MPRYAYWKTADYPYLTGGEVIATHGERVKVKGQGHKLLLPVAIVDSETGKTIQTHIEALRVEYEKNVLKVQQTYAYKATNLLTAIKNEKN